jgi:hypothetical protein
MLTSKSTKTLLLLALSATALTGCSSGGISQHEIKSPDPSSSSKESGNPETKFPVGLDYSQKIVLANDELGVEFLTIALNSCKKAQTDGFIVKDVEAKDESYFIPSADGPWEDWPFQQVTVANGKVSMGKYFNYSPTLLSPCDLEIQARRVEPGAVLLEHKVRRISDTSYTWAQHNGGNNLDEVTFNVKNGLIVGYNTEDWHTNISYGPLTKAQLALFDEVTQ